VTTSILDADRKRIHMGCRFACGRLSDAVATGEVMLLHVHQGDKPTSAPFPPAVERKLESLKLPADASAAWMPRSRRIELQRRPVT
jgi:acyl-CoA thioesterase FadM